MPCKEFYGNEWDEHFQPELKKQRSSMERNRGYCGGITEEEENSLRWKAMQKKKLRWKTESSEN